MLVKPQIEALLPHVDNRYSLAILVAKRARQLVDGAQPLSDNDSPNNVSIACQELDEDRIVCVRGARDFHIPIRPEIEAARLEKQRAAENAAAVENIKDMFSRLDEPEGERDDAASILRQIEALGDTSADAGDPVADLLSGDDAAVPEETTEVAGESGEKED
ncbi:MAG: DNA-directed RNA polymerase subunit omega [Clostridia bacterium]|nr:DNA-directed RNA polymerase subunit omega [Clostridia bacterium]